MPCQRARDTLWPDGRERKETLPPVIFFQLHYGWRRHANSEEALAAISHLHPTPLRRRQGDGGSRAHTHTSTHIHLPA